MSPYWGMANNPLSLTDPTGEIIPFIAVVIGAAVVSGGVNVALNAGSISNAWDALGFFGVGAVAGAAGALTGGAAAVGWGAVGTALSTGGSLAATSTFGAALAVGAAGGGSSGFILGAGNTALQGGSVGDVFKNGLFGGFTGAATGASLAGVGYGIGKGVGKILNSIRQKRFDKLADRLKSIDIPDIDGRPISGDIGKLSPGKSKFNTINETLRRSSSAIDELSQSASQQNLSPIEGYTARGITNPVPGRLARVIPGNISGKTLGAPGATDVFVTAADDIAGLSAKQIANRLTIPYSRSGFKVIEFNTPRIGIASPINRTNPGFVGFGRTAGGAREFVLPNQVIPSGSTIRIIR